MTSQLLLITAIVTGCVTNRRLQPQQDTPPAAEIAKPGSKQATPSQEEAPAKPLLAPQTAQPLDTQSSFELFNRFVDQSIQLTSKDYAELEALFQAPNRDIMGQAALMAGFVRRIFDRTSSQSDSETPLSLEAATIEAGLDIAKAIKVNPVLRNYPFLSLLRVTLDRTKNSEPFEASLGNAILAQAALWRSLAGDKLPEVASTPGPDAPPKIQTPQSFDSGDLFEGDALLLEAQKLAERGDYKSAISKVAGIGEADPFFPAARERIRNFSNQAVRDLRRKAAESFQSAVPVADSKAKYDYLIQAQSYLKEALETFPEADQLDTVRENLAVITRDLTRLEDTLGSEKETPDSEQETRRNEP